MTPTRTRLATHRAALAAALLAGTALAGLAPGFTAPAFAAPAEPGTAVNAPAVTQPAKPLADFSGLVAQVKPAVVSITTRFKATPAALEGAPQFGPQGLPFPFSQMFPQMQPHGGPRGGEQQPGGEARGSGFIIDAEGTIVTNNHVVKDATKVTVTLDDGTELQAKVIGRDSRTDIAVLKVTANRKLPFIELGQSRDVRPGEWVVAMGNPFGLGGSVTAGIVSAVSRDIGSGPYDQFIQIDAPINHGNSGGPLFTQDGKVIGMNTAIYSPSGGSVGIGFAIPSDQIRLISAQLQKDGQVTRGYIGVEAQVLTGATAKALRVPENAGALLAGVRPNGPAAEAGLEPGDIIQAVNGQKIANPKELALNIAAVPPGKPAKLDVLHDGKVKEVTLKVGQLPDDRVAESDRGPGDASGPKIGLQLAPLSPELRGQLDVPDGAKGAVVRGVEPGSAAQQAGLRPGDVILSVGGQKTPAPEDVVKAVRAAATAKDPAVALRILRNGNPAFVAVALERAEAEG